MSTLPIADTKYRQSRYILLRAFVASMAIAGTFSASGGSLSLEAHETGTADGTVTNWITDWGSYDRDFHREKLLLVAIHDMSRKQKTPVTVHIYFMARPQGHPEPVFVYGYTKQTIEFRGLIEVKGEVSAPRLDANVQHYAALGEHFDRGADIDGWIVTGEADGKVFQVCASRPGLQDLASRQPEKLEAMKADYAKSK